MTGIFESDKGDATGFGLFDGHLDRERPTDLAQGGIPIHNRPGRPGPLDPGLSLRPIPPAFDPVQVSTQQFGSVGKNPHRISQAQGFGRGLGILWGKPGFLQCELTKMSQIRNGNAGWR